MLLLSIISTFFYSYISIIVKMINFVNKIYIN